MNAHLKWMDVFPRMDEIPYSIIINSSLIMANKFEQIDFKYEILRMDTQLSYMSFYIVAKY